MKNFCALTLVVLFSLSIFGCSESAPPKPIEQNKPNIDQIRRSFNEMDKILGGFSAEEKNKLEAVAHEFEESIKKDPLQLQTAAGAAKLQEKLLSGYRAALTSEHAAKYDEYVASSANVKKIVLACKAFAEANPKKELPRDLGDLVAKDLCPPELLVKKGTALPADFAKMDPKDKGKWVTEHADFEFPGTGKDLERITATPGFVVVYDKGGFYFGCIDGRVAIFPAADIPAVLKDLAGGTNPPEVLQKK